jgi:hypothetical protein
MRQLLCHYYNEFDGLFNIPQSDSTHVWVLNFEENYMAVHDATTFQMPAACIVYSMEYPSVRIPMTIISNGDTLSTEHTYWIDTGICEDIAIIHPAKEVTYLSQRTDAVWLETSDWYKRSYTVDINLNSNMLPLKDVQVYTFEKRNNLGCLYLIGLNFLKRFNIFFDMKNKRVGFQPIANFQRLDHPRWRHFYFHVNRLGNGKCIVDKVGEYKENFFKTAGLLEGDEIVRIDDMPYDSAERLWFYGIAPRANTLKMDIIRNGSPIQLTVLVDWKEMTGDLEQNRMP